LLNVPLIWKVKLLDARWFAGRIVLSVAGLAAPATVAEHATASTAAADNWTNLNLDITAPLVRIAPDPESYKPRVAGNATAARPFRTYVVPPSQSPC